MYKAVLRKWIGREVQIARYRLTINHLNLFTLYMQSINISRSM